jgi:hypothetical protein
MIFQLVFYAPNGFQMMARWWKKQEWLECFGSFAQKLQIVKMVIFANERILVFRWLQLGLESAENEVIYVCLALLMKALIKVNLNEANLHFC